MITSTQPSKSNQPQNLVLLHGWACDHRMWAPFLAQLTQHYRIHILELANYAQSLKVLGHQLLKKAPEKAIWVGFSFGGLLALQAAILEPHRVQKLVMISSTPRWLATDTWPAIPATFFEKFKKDFNQSPVQALDDFYAFTTLGLSQPLKKHMQHVICSTPRKYLSSALDIMENTDLREAFGKLNIPSLFLFGAHDPLLKQSMAKTIRKLNPLAQTKIIPQFGHFPFKEGHDVF